MADIDAIVIGAGVVGLAVTRELAGRGLSTVVLEAANAIGTGTSSRNSEVIHAGLYYPQGSLKARLCVEGRERLYDFCESHAVPHRRCGKLIVATTPEEVSGLENLLAKGRANGCGDLVLLSRAEALALEPALDCLAALHSPSTGIIDSHAYMLALQGDAERDGAAIAFNTPFESARREGNAFFVRTGGAEPTTLSTTILVNAAGLHASKVAGRIEGLAAAHAPPTRYAKGNYFLLSVKAPFSRLIYPAPQAHGLGVHLTLDLGGQARFGPDVEWVEEIAYGVNPARGEGFSAAIRRYWPGLPEGALSLGYCGIRPKICGPGDPAPDFRVDGPELHGLNGLVNLFGIESPGLTASLAIAREAANKLDY